jgi:hypothetical protein
MFKQAWKISKAKEEEFILLLSFQYRELSYQKQPSAVFL